MANALLYPENQEKLRFRQHCGQIAHKHGKKDGPLVLSESRIAFSATIQSQKGLLPVTIKSSMKLAHYFFDFMLISTGLKSAEIAFITFKSRDHLNRFIQTNDRRLVPTGEALSVTLIEGDAEAERTTEREEKQRLRNQEAGEVRERVCGLRNCFF
ncbi:hypothetical protein F5B21DRAFT_32051 [Xylaria acuta]|nr:hypothetical protein F5B21DRAFT_32051 [Xylaria acuta]